MKALARVSACVALAMAALLATAALFAAEIQDDDDSDELRNAAKGGDSAAQYQLGNEYFYGERRKRNLTLAAFWYRKAAESGNPAAQFNFAVCLDRGLGVDERDPHEAFLWYERAAKAGIPQAKFNYALMLKNGIHEDRERKKEAVSPSPGKARRLLEELCALPFAPALTEYAKFLLESQEENGDAVKAVALLEKAADSGRGDCVAMRMLADCAYEGEGCRKDPEVMLRWLSLAAVKGDLEAKAKLAFCYEFGRGVKEDRGRAKALYKEAAEGGFPMAQVKYGEFIEEDAKEPEAVKQAVADALGWYAKAAAADCPQGYFKLGVHYLNGLGVESSEKAAFDNFFKAARLDYVKAQYNVACMYSEGRGVAPDPSAAFYWFRQGAIRGDVNSQRRLAICYLEGKGTEKNALEGMRWMRRAAKSGDPAARAMVGDVEAEF